MALKRGQELRPQCAQRSGRTTTFGPEPGRLLLIERPSRRWAMFEDRSDRRLRERTTTAAKHRRPGKNSGTHLYTSVDTEDIASYISPERLTFCIPIRRECKVVEGTGNHAFRTPSAPKNSWLVQACPAPASASRTVTPGEGCLYTEPKPIYRIRLRSLLLNMWYKCSEKTWL